MLLTLTARSRLLGSSQVQQWACGLIINGVGGDPCMQAIAPCQAAAESYQQYSSSSSSSSHQQAQRWQQHWRSSQLLLPQCVQQAVAARCKYACFSTSSASAQRQQQDPQQSRQMQSKYIRHEYKSPTLNAMLPEHCTHPMPLLQAGVLPNPVKTAKHLWRIIQTRLGISLALASAAKNIPGYDGKLLPQQIAAMYVRINEAQAAFSLDRIKDLVSRDMFLKLRAQAEQRRMGNWDKIIWQLEDEEEWHENSRSNIKLVDGRAHKITKESSFVWIQLTYCIRSKQRFAAYRVRKGAKDELVAGNPDEVIDVEDYWVFEHKTHEPVEKQQVPVETARWRLVKRQTRL